MIDKGLLHRMQFATIGETFDRGHVVALRGDCKRQARQYAPSIHQNRAGAALAVIATFFCAGQRKALTQQIKQ